MQSLSRVKFSEELFGAISDENECIICMTPFTSDDMITKLDCSGNHYYHTSCIENWINNETPAFILALVESVRTKAFCAKSMKG